MISSLMSTDCQRTLQIKQCTRPSLEQAALKRDMLMQELMHNYVGIFLEALKQWQQALTNHPSLNCRFPTSGNSPCLSKCLFVVGNLSHSAGMMLLNLITPSFTKEYPVAAKSRPSYLRNIFIKGGKTDSIASPRTWIIGAPFSKRTRKAFI